MATEIKPVVKSVTVSSADGGAQKIIYSELYDVTVVDGAVAGGARRESSEHSHVASPNGMSYERRKSMDNSSAVIYDEILFFGHNINTNDFNSETGDNFNSNDIDNIAGLFDALMLIK